MISQIILSQLSSERVFPTEYSLHGMACLTPRNEESGVIEFCGRGQEGGGAFPVAELTLPHGILRHYRCGDLPCYGNLSLMHILQRESA